MNFIVMAVALGAWVFTYVLYRRGEKRWSDYEKLVIPGSPSVTVREVMLDQKKSPYLETEPVFFGRLAATRAAQEEAVREWARIQTVKY